ncbi:RlmF-related methyltransferase [Methanococcus maripaludis]|jgi:methylase of polypeptide subunit release factors|uniref:RlmF-related methyltransferase n=3 Tax=Methanococcus maripaludis TaxID=39152 RepID=A0A8T3W077_METMI|nr:RlmF-related methyltransferase [Methanococcus maripaludis]AEK20360.1 SAM-binding motif-containing protein [Methanococcus maripaludis X1]MBG0768934.1 RlmF-related methyltransferase [Methanococcus maripaludis]BAP61679.1 hypothetical protein MMKA1_15620 [Methanococcus maripaludis KA1]
MKTEPLELGLKIEDAILVNEKLKDFVVYKSGKPRIDFKNKEAMKEYNVAILGHVFGLDMDFHEDALIPTPINRYLFIKNIFDEKDDIKDVLEIGTGSGIISILIAKYFGCNVTATDTVSDYLKIAKDNISKNNLTSKINLIDSKGKIIFDIPELKNKKFDLIISYPPYYADNSVASKRSFGGAFASEVELIGGGAYGEVFSQKIIEEGMDHLNNGGIVAIMFPEKPFERRKFVEDKILELGLTLEKSEITTGKRIRHIIKAKKE